MINLDDAHRNMINNQIRPQHVVNDALLKLINDVSRDFFVPQAYQNLAYTEMDLPIGHDQVMMKPQEESYMLQELAITKHNNILEIGTGTGYITALLAQLGKQVDSVDIFEDFTKNASAKLAQLNINNVNLVTADASEGYDNNINYDVIVITASMPLLPKVYLDSLAQDGRLFVVLGEAPVMQAMLYQKKGDDWTRTSLFETTLPAMINAPKPNPFKF